MAWPAVETEPLEEQEKRMRLGVDFHQLVHRYITGLPVDVLEKSLVDSNLSRWWRNYMVYRPYDHPGMLYPEITLTLPIEGYRLVAKYDLLIVEAGKQLIILDWKTTQFLPRKAQLLKRMQTKIYRYVAALAGEYLFEGLPLVPENCEMIYWFPEYPESPIRFAYDSAQFESDHSDLTGLITEIAALSDEDFRLTTDTKRCSYCRYRSYCGTSEHVGRIESYDDEPVDSAEGLDFDFEHIAEIEF
jgi:hypothetical protein